MTNKISSPSIRFIPAAPRDSMNFGNGSLEEFLSAGLTGKMKKAGAIFAALKLGFMINSFVNKNGETIEERVVNREVGLRLAEYFARNFIDDPIEAQVFIEGANKYAIRDTMLEKGYYFWYGQAYEIYKPIPNSIIYKRSSVNWSNDDVEKFAAYEQQISRAMNDAIDSIDNNAVAKKIEQILAEYVSVTSNAKKDEAPDGIQWFIEMQNRLSV